MLTPFALFAALLVATAFIAHWSDNLGKKLGKKRVSIWGFRPRTSATILTVASSWVIMIVTLAALLIVVPNLQRALFRYDSERASFNLAKQEAQRAGKQARLARQQTKTAREQTRLFLGERDHARNETARAQSLLERTNLQLSGAKEAQQNAEAGTRAAQKRTVAAQKSAAGAKSAASRAQNQEQAARAALGGVQSALEQNQKNLNAAQARLSNASRDLNNKQAQVLTIQNKLQTTNGQLSSTNLKLSAANKQLFAAGKQLFKAGKEVLNAEKKVRLASAEVDKLNFEIKRLQAEQTFLVDNAVQSLDIASQLATDDIAIPVDLTLAERRFDASRNPQQIERELSHLVEIAREAQKKSDNEVFKNADLKVAATVVDRVTNTPVNLNEKQAIELYAQALSSTNQMFSARLASAFNYPSTTKIIFARFVFVPVRTLYTTRELIGSKTIDAAKSEPAIFGELQKLVDRARYNAVLRGASPPLSLQENNFFDGDTGQKMFDTLRQLQKIKRPTEVRVVAARDLDAAEPLQIRFEIGSQT